MIVFIFDWFKPTHCDKCAAAAKRGDAIFDLMVNLTWDETEQSNLRQAAAAGMHDEEN